MTGIFHKSAIALYNAVMDEPSALSAERQDSSLRRIGNAARRATAAYHRKNPLLRAMPRRQLRAALELTGALPDDTTLFTFLLNEGILVTEGTRGVRLPDHHATLPPRWQAPADEILTVYRSAGLNPPSPSNFQANFPRDIHVDSILLYLADNGDLLRLSDSLYLAMETVDSVKEALRDIAAREPEEGITVGAVRDATGSSRKIIVSLLERFDRDGYTRRDGDTRHLT